MSDSEEEADEPAVELGEGPSVDGAPLARVVARQTWPKEKSEIVARDGDIPIRSADGPIPLADLLVDVDDTYFGTEQQFLEAVRSQLPPGPVLTEE